MRDLSSKLVVEESQELALKDDSPLLDRIISHIDQFFIRHQKKLERLTSIAITLPGIIDTENGIVHRMPFYEDVKEMPLGEALEQHTGVPVYIQHDISAWTMAEALFGASRGARDVIQVVIDHNVGRASLPMVICYTQAAVASWRLVTRRSTHMGNAVIAEITAASKPLPVWTVFLSWHSCVSINP